jgi:PKD repeat protein
MWWWDFGDGDTSSTQNPSHTYIDGNGGTYLTQLRVWGNGCSSIRKEEITVTTTGIGDIIEFDLRVYPNPIGDRLIVEIGEHEAGVIRVVNLLGQEVISQQVNRAQNPIDAATWGPGIYMITFESGEVARRAKVIKHSR